MSVRVTVFSAWKYEHGFLRDANRAHGFDLDLRPERLTPDSAAVAAGAVAVAAFVSDDLGRATLAALRAAGVGLVALRCAGYNHVDRAAAAGLGLALAYVPAYSPHAVAEHAMALILALNRKTHVAHARVRVCDFRLDGLMGFDLHGKTAGVVGTGRIGAAMCGILLGFGCRVLAYDPRRNEECAAKGVGYVALDELLAASDVVSLHCPLTEANRHLIDARALTRMKPGAMLINTARGGVIDTAAVVEALKSGRLGALGIDVYEHEAALFFADRSCEVLQDDLFARLIAFPNVLITGHQGFCTREAVARIAETTLANIATWAAHGVPAHPVPD